MIQVYQDIVQPVVRFPWESMREHEPSRLFTAASGQFVTVGTPAVLAEPITMTIWSYTDSVGGNQGPICVSNAGSNDHHWGIILVGSDVRFRTKDTDIAQASLASSAIVNTWQHLLGETASTSSRFISVDNVQSAEETTDQAVVNSGIDNTTVGAWRRGSDGLFWSGRLMWPCVWDVILTPSEKTRLSSGVPPWWVRPESIVSCPDLGSLWDPFLRESFTDTNGTVIANPYRDWTLPDDTAQFIDTPAAAEGDPEGPLVGGKLIRGGILTHGRLVA